MLSALAVAGLLVSLMAPTSLPAGTPTDAEAVVPDGVAVDVVTVNGSGCPGGTGTATVSQGGTLVEVTSPAYFALDGDAAAPTDFRRNCQFSLQVTRPAGWTYAVVRVASSGFAYLPAGATGTSRISLYFQGTSPTTALTATFDGPMADTWRAVHTIPPGDLTFAPCDAERLLNVNTELRVSAGGDPGATVFLARDPGTSLRLAWTRCP